MTVRLVVRFCMVGMAFLVASCASQNPYYNPSKPHHTPTGFVNSDGKTISKPLSDLLRWYRERFGEALPPPPGKYLASYEAFPVQKFTSVQVEKLGPKTATWLGHATVLVRVGGFSVLTDPHFSERAFPVQWAGPKRKVPSPVSVDELPSIDVVVISHSHYDHLDKNTIQGIARVQPNTLFLVPLGVEKILASWGVHNTKALDWWEEHTVKNTKLTLVPAYHWSARTLTDRNETLWGGWAVSHPELNFYFSGDTGYSEDFKQIGQRLGPFDFSAIAVGAYEPRWFMKAQHVNPDEAVQIHKDVASKQSIGVHWGTFELTDEALDQPIGDLREAIQKRGLDQKAFRLLEAGETIKLN